MISMLTLALVRLVNGSHSCSGRVEVFNDDQWGTVCDNGWDHSDAAVICKEMSLNKGSVVILARDQDQYG